MRKKSVNTLLVFGVVVAIILLMIWLFSGQRWWRIQVRNGSIEQTNENNKARSLRTSPFLI